MLKLLSLTDGIAFSFISLVLYRLSTLIPKLLRELRNDLTLKPVSSRTVPRHNPKVSIIIPAKDESATIEAVARSILASSYSNIELILIDDRSQDNTFELMNAIARSDPRVKTMRINELQKGWTGKTHALSHGVNLAEGDIFLFSDADAFFGRELLQTAVCAFCSEKIDLLSLIPSFKDAGFIEKALYPHMALGISYFYPMSEVNDPGCQDSAIASGCFIMVSRDSYKTLGGWGNYKSEVTEDIAISKAAKLAGMRVVVMLAGDQLRTMPFSSLDGMIGFWVRTFYGGLNKSARKSLTLLLNYSSLTVVSFLFVFYACDFFLIGHDRLNSYLMMAFGAIVLGVIVSSSVFLQKYNGRPGYGVYSPLGIFLGAWIAFNVLTRIYSGSGVMWRGNRYQ